MDFNFINATPFVKIKVEDIINNTLINGFNIDINDFYWSMEYISSTPDKTTFIFCNHNRTLALSWSITNKSFYEFNKVDQMSIVDLIEYMDKDSYVTCKIL